MSKSLMASKLIMKNYLSELLTESASGQPDSSENNIQDELMPEMMVEEAVSQELPHKETQSLERLLQKVSEPKESFLPTTLAEVESLEEIEDVTAAVEDADVVANLEEVDNTLPLSSKKSYREGDFQAMFFDVAGLIVAVPLIELGGIHKVDKINSLMGKPSWFKGVMLYRDEKINIVDTALWVMPEKCDEKLLNSLNYEYIIMLDDSSWGLMAENLVDTVVMSQDEVKWLDHNEKRPWLAGLVKDKMCALLDVSALIELLDKGNNIYEE